jgi:hypothetical protein
VVKLIGRLKESRPTCTDVLSVALAGHENRLQAMTEMGAMPTAAHIDNDALAIPAGETALQVTFRERVPNGPHGSEQADHPAIVYEYTTPEA